METYKIKVSGIRDGKIEKIIYNFKTDIVFEYTVDLHDHLDKIQFGRQMQDEEYFSIVFDYILHTPKKRTPKFTFQQLLDYLVEQKSIDEITLGEVNKAFPLFESYIKKLPAMEQFNIVSEAVKYAYDTLGEKSRALMSKSVTTTYEPEIKPQRENLYDNFYGKRIDFIGQEHITDKLKSAFLDKRILFIENDNSLSYQIGDFYQWVISENIKHYCLFNAKNTSLEFIAEKINQYDMIAYMSQYVNESTYKLIEYVKKLQQPKTILECYISEPHWFTLPEDVVHEVYILTTNDIIFKDKDKLDWKFDKLEVGKSYWENE